MDINATSNLLKKKYTLNLIADNCTDKKNRQLSFQLFGKPVIYFDENEQHQHYQYPEYLYKEEPFVKLPAAIGENYEAREISVGKGEENKGDALSVLKRCLICYSILEQETRKRSQESVDNLNEFLQLLTFPLNVQVTAFEKSTNQTSNSTGWLCDCCNSACKLLLCKHQAIKRLKEQVSELKLKFFSAIKLSQKWAEEECILTESCSSDRQRKQVDENNQAAISIGHVNIVNRIRKCLLQAGLGKCKKYTDTSISKVPTKRKSNRRSCASPTIKRRSRQCTVVKCVDLNSFPKAKNVMDMIQTSEIKAESTNRSVKQEKFTDATAVETDMLASSNQFEDDLLEQDIDYDDDFSTRQENTCGFTTEDSNKLISTFIEDKQPLGTSKTVSKKQRDQRNLYYRQRRRYIKEKFPGLKRDEAISAYRSLPREEKLQRRGKGKPNFKRRRPISQLREKHYVKFRLKPESEKMSILEYNKIRREILVKEQNVKNKDGLPTRASKGLGGGLNLWKKQDGKNYFRGMEIRKNEEGFHLCPFQCPNFVSIRDKNALARHINKFHVDLSEAYSCDQCEAKFYYNYDLRLHQKEKHEGGFQCELCGAHLSNRCTLNQHIRVKHHGIKPHICEHCGKGFASRKDLTIHVRRHTGERPFVCQDCSESFVDKQSLKLHLRRKHPNDSSLDLK